MTDQVLDIFKLVLLALLYLFFARVLWAVWSEVREPIDAKAAIDYNPGIAATTTTKPPKGRGGAPARLIFLEPKQRRGTAVAIDTMIGIGRDADNTIQITDDTYISNHHAAVSIASGNIVLDDLGSRNGTYLNGTKINAQRSVHIGDRIQVGYTVLEAQ